MKHVDVKGSLIGNTIRVIAREGLEKTTTKEIVKGTGINEAYIYRYFIDKYDLLEQVFDSLDEELLLKIKDCVRVMGTTDVDFQSRLWAAFSQLWRFLLSNSEKCLAYIRYYYSPYFKKNSIDSHHERFACIVDGFAVAFKPGANVWMILNHIMNVMLDFSVKVFNDEVADDNDTAEHVYRLVYSSIKQYLNNEEDKV